MKRTLPYLLALIMALGSSQSLSGAIGDSMFHWDRNDKVHHIDWNFYVGIERRKFYRF